MDDKQRMDVLKVVSEIVNVAARSGRPLSEQLHDVTRALRALPGLQAIDLVSFRYDEYEIRAGIASFLEVQEKVLRRLQSLALAAAPEFVELLRFGDGEGLLITRYSACAGEQLARVDSTKAPFLEPAIQRFRKDMLTLADHGLVHPYAARSFYHWMVSSVTGTLVLNSWVAVKEGDEEECAEMVSGVDWRLKSRS